MNIIRAVKLDVIGLKCDTNHCGYREEGRVLTYKYIRENIDRPCPMCGASLLTPEDAHSTMLLKAITTITNIALFPWMLITLPIRIFMKDKDARMSVEMNGTGDVKFIDKTKQPRQDLNL